MKKALLAGAVALLAGALAQSGDLAQAQNNGPAFAKKAYNYNAWTKGKFSEAVTVTNPGRFIFIGGTGDESEQDGHILHPGDFYGQCKHTFAKIKKALALNGASLKDVVTMTIYITDMRHYLTDWVKCRGEEYKGYELPASALINVTALAWPYMMLEIQTEAVVAK
ncbi:MAG: RidA family protein [Stellaceae bacterium]